MSTPKLLRAQPTPLLVQLVVLALLTPALASCASRYLQSPVIAPDVELRNTPRNTAIVELIEDFQFALGERNFQAIRGMVSPRYHENAGTTDTTADDYGVDGLLELLDLIETHARDVQVELQIREVQHDERRDRASVIYEFSYVMLYHIDGQDMWDTGRDLNRLELAWEDERWWVIGGL